MYILVLYRVLICICLPLNTLKDYLADKHLKHYITYLLYFLTYRTKIINGTTIYSFTNLSAHVLYLFILLLLKYVYQ